MNPAVLVGLLGVGLGLFLLTGTASAATPSPTPPGPTPPGPKPVKDCTPLADKVQSDANIYYQLMQKGAAKGDLCNGWKNLQESLKACEDAGCAHVDVSTYPAPTNCDGKYVPPGVDCSAELAAFAAADQAARVAVQSWTMNTVSSQTACALVQAREAASGAVAAKGCEIPGDDFDDQGVCDVSPVCDQSAAVLSQWSSLVAEGQIEQACAVLAQAQAAYDAMAAADCDLRNWGRPEMNCGGGGGVTPPEPSEPTECAQWAANYNNLAAQINTLAQTQGRCAAYTASIGLAAPAAALNQLGCTASVNTLLSIDPTLSSSDCGGDEGGGGNVGPSGGGGATPAADQCSSWENQYNQLASQVNQLVAAGDLCGAYSASVALAGPLSAMQQMGCDTSGLIGTPSLGPDACGGGSAVSGALNWGSIAGFQPLPRWPE